MRVVYEKNLFKVVEHRGFRSRWYCSNLYELMQGPWRNAAGRIVWRPWWTLRALLFLRRLRREQEGERAHRELWGVSRGCPLE